MRPAELDQFAKTGLLDPAFAFSANSAARTYYNQNGLLVEAAANQPRFTFDLTTGVCKGLMAYGSVTNLHTNSEVLSASSGTTVSANSDTAPDGTVTMDSLIEDSSVGEHYGVDFTFTPVVGRYYVYSYHVKALGAGSARRAHLRFAAGNVASIPFNLATKAFGTSSGAAYISSGYEEYKPGEFRAWVVMLASSATSTVARPQLDNGSASSYTGDGVSGLKIWGRQLDEFTYQPTRPNPYVKTAGSAVVTAADVASKPVSVGSKYSIVAEFVAPNANISSAHIMQLDDGTSNERVILRVNSGVLKLFVVDGGVTQVDMSLGTLTEGVTYKIAARIEANNIAACVNGGTVSTDTSATLPTVTTLRVGSDTSGSNQLNSTIALRGILPGALTNTGLQAITR